MTNFFYFGNFGLDFVFHMFFLVRYCRLLEEGSYRGRTADFFYVLLLGCVVMTVRFRLFCSRLCGDDLLVVPLLQIVGPWIDLYFFGSALTFMIVYLWGRRNPQVRMNIFGVFNFTCGVFVLQNGA